MRATPTRLSFWAASVYLALGLLSGLFTREFTRGGEFESFSSTQLGTTHTHMLVLGFIMMLIVLLLDRTLGLTSKLFVWFFWIYNLGVMVTWGAMMTRGISTVQGGDLGAALSGIAGLGHILLSIALVMPMVWWASESLLQTRRRSSLCAPCHIRERGTHPAAIIAAGEVNLLPGFATD